MPDDAAHGAAHERGDYETSANATPSARDQVRCQQYFEQALGYLFDDPFGRAGKP
jgi:hypothetical protein